MAYNHTNDEFYKSARWKRMRERILRRDQYLCRECRRYGRLREASEVHHIKHLDEFPELAFVPENLISLCHGCHRKAHPEKAKGNAESEFKRY